MAVETATLRALIDASKIDTQHTPERIWLRLDGSDLDRLEHGLRRTCELFFHGSPAPRRVLIGTRMNWSRTPAACGRSIDAIASFDELQISTAHPQGGNALDRADRGVVRPDFRVREHAGSMRGRRQRVSHEPRREPAVDDHGHGRSGRRARRQ